MSAGITLVFAFRSTRWQRYPRILGHEGAGYVRAVGAKVEAAKIGDAVVLSYDYCEGCRLCSQSQPAYCENFHPLNVLGDRGSTFSTTGNSHSLIFGGFFGQSSFSSLSVVGERAVVRISDLLRDEGELKLLGPLGCGFQTWAGAVTISGSAASGDVVVVAGLGAVGFGAIMAAQLVGCKTIIAIDQIDSRLELARQIGATEVLTTADRSELGKQLSKCLGDQRVSLVM
jgi:Zn-dependent alcohol dehydrogenase